MKSKWKLTGAKINPVAIGCLVIAWIFVDLVISGILAILGLGPLEALRQWAEVSAPTWALGLFYGGGYVMILALWTFIQCIFTITIGVFITVAVIIWRNWKSFQSDDEDPLMQRLRDMGGQH